MVNQKYYSIKSIPQQVRFDNHELTLHIGKIKSRIPSVFCFKLHCYDKYKYENDEYVIGDEIYTYTSDRWVVAKEYHNITIQFTLPETSTISSTTYNVLDDTYCYVLELILYNVDSENPLYFNQLMLTDKEFTGYHEPSELIKDIEVGFANNTYVNLYNTDTDYLQIIRPNKEVMSTSAIMPSQYTVLAPHISNESSFDDPVALLYEFMYQNEQVIGVDK